MFAQFAKKRIGVLGLSHDHVWHLLADLKLHENAQLVAVADEHRRLLDKAQADYDCTTYRDAEQMLEQEQLDAVLVFGDNAGGVEAAELAAAKKLPILIEKPMAADLDGAERMLAAARRAGVPLMVNWPFAWLPQLQHALRLAADGAIGDVWQVKYRAAHQGPREHGCSDEFCDWLYDEERNGGGALIDYCCYGAVLARAVLGVPSRVTAVAGRLIKEDQLTEDNAVVLMSYPRAIAISEGSWTQIGELTQYIATIYGTRGTLQVEPRPNGRLLLATAEQPSGVPVEVPALPEARRSAVSHFLDAIGSHGEFMALCQARIGRDAQEILEAAQVSVASGAAVSLPLN